MTSAKVIKYLRGMGVKKEIRIHLSFGSLHGMDTIWSEGTIRVGADLYSFKDKKSLMKCVKNILDGQRDPA